MISVSRNAVGATLALTILVVLTSLTFRLIVKPMFELPASLQSDIISLAGQLSEMHRQTGHEAALQLRQRTASAALQQLDTYWSGPSRTQIAAAMQDLLRSATLQSNGQVVSTSIGEDDKTREVLAVRARMTGSLITLTHVLAALEMARPRLYVDTLNVTAPFGTGTPTRPQELSFELEISGYVVASGIETR